MTIHIGVTGTRAGCTTWQLSDLLDTLREYTCANDTHGVALHFGDCIGVDYQAFHLAKALKFTTVAHPPADPTRRAFCDADVIKAEKPYMHRNADIVAVVSELIVVPSGPEADNPRSGTWATYRMAVKAGVETVVIEP